jgi:quercetin dioxygenase-like cupin family protein
MEIKRAGSQASNKGPADYFTGTVRVDPLFDSADPGRAVGASVTFEPSARTAWHTHPLGQTLIVTAGFGRAQRWGGPVEGIRPGDVVWFPAGEKHWHGAGPTTAMTHIAIQEKLEGKDSRVDGTRRRRAIPGGIIPPRVFVPPTKVDGYRAQCRLKPTHESVSTDIVHF